MLRPDDVHDTDQTGHVWKMISDRSLGTGVSSQRQDKVCISAVPMFNAMESREIDPWFIVKAKQLLCFRAHGITRLESLGVV